MRLDDRLQKQVIDFAHANGMPVTSHEIYPAVASGADGVEHIRGTSRRGYSPKVTALNRSYQDVIDLLTASKMTITPTIGIQGAFPLALARDPSRLDDPRFRTLFPASVVHDDGAAGEEHRAGRPSSALAAALRPLGETVRRVVKGGGIVIAGTDSPIFPVRARVHTELEIFAQSGLTPFEVLQTATTRAAEALGEGANLGSIEAGKLADLVIVTDDPLADVKNARKVRTVIKNGEVHTLEELVEAIGDRPTGGQAVRSAGRRRFRRILADDDGPRTDRPVPDQPFLHVRIGLREILGDGFLAAAKNQQRARRVRRARRP